MDDKEIKIKLMNYSIEYIMNNGSLKGIEDSLLKGGLIDETTKEDKEESKDTKEIIIEEEPTNEESTTNTSLDLYNELKQTGMYTKEALPHVASEFGSNITETIENPFKDELEETEEIEVEEPPKVDYTKILNEIKHSGVIMPNEEDTSKEESKAVEKIVEEEPKVELPKKVETKSNNPWSDIKTVSPGEIKL